MRAFVVSRLFIVAFVCRGVLTTEVWAGDKISPDQATGLAKELESAIHAKDTVAAAALLDIDALVNRTLEGIPPSDFQRGYRSAFTRNRSGTIMGPLIKLAEAGGSCRFLRARQVNGETRVLFRVISHEGALNYLDFVVGPDADGRPKVRDFFSTLTGELVSLSIRRHYLAVQAEGRPTLSDRLTGADKVHADNFAKIKSVSDRFAKRDYEGVLDAYKSLPLSLQRDKTFLLFRLVASQKLRETSADEYDSAMNDFQRLFPGDPCLDLICLDSRLTAGKYEEALTSLDHIEAYTEADPYLDVVRANVRVMRNGAGDLGEATRLYRKAKAMEPTLADAYWGLVNVSLKTKDYEQTAVLLSEVERKLALRIKNLEGVAAYADFVKSDAYRRWRASRDEPATKPVRPMIGVHVSVGGGAAAEKLSKSIPALGKMGVNALVMEVDYNFVFASHPELNGPGALTKQEARALGDLCRANGIRPIPSLNCLGHQSWAKRTLPLLAKHPELDETPGKYPENQGIYCRSWCPLNPEVNRIVFPLIDELIDAFGADAFHVGMDEVFILADDDCPRCKGKDPAELFAKQVNDLHRHLVGERKVEMFMWGDRLLDAKALGYSRWEASANNTWRAADLISKDIVICDWHYEKQRQYKSVPFLLEKGFRVWPAGWHDADAAAMLMDYSITQNDPRMIGYLSTTWGRAKLDELADFAPTKLAAAKFSPRK